MNIKSLISLIVLIPFFLQMSAKSSSSFKVIRNESLPSYNRDEEKNSITRFVSKYDEYTKMNIAYNILEGINPLSFSVYTDAAPIEDSSVLSLEAIHDLALFKGESNPKASVFKTIDRSVTSFGRGMLQHMIANPLTDRDAIYQRASIVQRLILDKELREKIKYFLHSIAETEDFLFSFWDYSKDKELLFGHLAGMRMSESDHKDFSEQMKQKGLALIEKLDNTLTLDWKIHNGYKIFKDLMPVLQVTLAALYVGFGIIALPIVPPIGYSFIGGGALTLTIFGLFSLPEYREFIKSYIDLSKTMNGTSRCFSAIQELFSQLQPFSHILSEMEFVPNAIAQFDPKEMDANFSELLTLLKSSAISHNNLSDYFIRFKGKVVAAFNRMKMFRENGSMSSIARAVGTIDAYVSMAEITEESQEHANQLNFVNLLQNDVPLIFARKLWNPMINFDSAVGNDIAIGKEYNAPNAIISGPNAGGKSSFIKATALLLIFGQSFGIAPVSSAQITPYHKINTYLNITDDIAQGRSLFQMEALRAIELAREIRNTDKKQFVFTIMDEVFSGTNPTEGAAAAYSIARSLSEEQNSTLIIASHFGLMHQLEADTHGAFKNLKVSAKIRPISYDYQVTPGPSEQRIAIEVLKEAGHDIRDILKYAEEILEQPTKYGLN